MGNFSDSFNIKSGKDWNIYLTKAHPQKGASGFKN